MTDQQIALPVLNIPDVQEYIKANPDMAHVVPGVGFCVYDPVSKTGWICFGDTHEWNVTQPVERRDFMERIANCEAINRAKEKAPAVVN
jgi:hypothetical protein